MTYAELIPELIRIARYAGEAMLDIYHNETDFGVELKSDDSPLTRADRAANELICQGLEKLSLQFPIISEENRNLPWEDRQHWKQYWLVDPLDGTKEFIKRNGDFTINIALVEEGYPVLGLVYVPVHDELCWAVSGHGAFLLDGGELSAMQVATFRESDAGLKIVCSRSHLTPETEAFVQRYKDPVLVSRGSSLKFLMLADGSAHIYPRLGPTMEWDTAAAQAVLEAAGGSVVVAETGERMRYNKPDLKNPHFIAWGFRL